MGEDESENVCNAIDIGGPTGLLFHGLIDDVRIYNRALSAAEVAQLFSQ
jgi:hypothetical protein